MLNMLQHRIPQHQLLTDIRNVPYDAAFQRNPDVVLAHAGLVILLAPDSNLSYSQPSTLRSHGDSINLYGKNLNLI